MRLIAGLSCLFLSCSAFANGTCTPANVTPAQLSSLRAEMPLAEVVGIMGCPGEPSSEPTPTMSGIGQTWTWGGLYPAPWLITVAFRNGRALAASGTWGTNDPITRFGAEFGNPEFLAH